MLFKSKTSVVVVHTVMGLCFTNNECLGVQWCEYFNELKDGIHIMNVYECNGANMFMS